MESTKIPFDYSNFSRDILFEGIQPNTKDKKREIFLIAANALFGKRIEQDTNWTRALEKIDLSRFYATSLKENDALDTWMDLSLELTRELDFYSTNFPFNVPYFPRNPYLKYIHKTREKWKYDPTEGRKKYERELCLWGVKEVLSQRFKKSKDLIIRIVLTKMMVAKR